MTMTNELMQTQGQQRPPQMTGLGLADRTQTLPDADQHFRLYMCGKRSLDILIAAVLLVLLAPLMLVIAVLVALDSPGPALFAQERVGARWKRKGTGRLWELSTFTVYKFRSMREDADAELHRAFVKAFIRQDHEGMQQIQNKCDKLTPERRGVFLLAFLSGRGDNANTRTSGDPIRKLVHDPRVTRMGRVLRRTSLDELPQLWNVFIGDMSLVGPRPAIPYEVEEYKPWHHRRMQAKPGLTGLWQVEGRSSVDFDEMVRLDIAYAQQQSFWLDLKILLKTPWAVLRGKGAA